MVFPPCWTNIAVSSRKRAVANKIIRAGKGILVFICLFHSYSEESHHTYNIVVKHPLSPQRSVEKCWRESQWISCISKVWINETHVKNLKEAKPKEGTTRIPSRWSAEKKRTSGEFSQPEDRSISDIDLHLNHESSSHSVTLSFRHQSSILLECQKHVRISGESLWTSQPLKPLHRPKGMQREREREGRKNPQSSKKEQRRVLKRKKKKRILSIALNRVLKKDGREWSLKSPNEIKSSERRNLVNHSRKCWDEWCSAQNRRIWNPGYGL